MNEKFKCNAATTFTLGEKLWAQSSFLGLGITATVGIILVNWIWVIPYIILYWYGIPGVIMRHTNCPRCPHLFEHNDCLQAPVFFTKWIVKQRKEAKFTVTDKILFYTIMLSIPIYPIYWLLANPILLIVFIVGVVMWYGGQLFHFCKHCQVEDCPFNQLELE